MNQYFLKFANEEAATTALLAIATTKDGAIIKQTNEYFIDIVGIITSTTQTGDESEPVINTTQLDGYHVNVLIGELPGELGQYRVMPTTPYRVFAGA